MDKSTLETYISQGLSLGQISKATNKSKTSIRHWLKKFDLKTVNKSFKEQPRTKSIVLINGTQFKTCPRCKEVKILKNEFNLQGNGYYYSWCKQCQKENIYDRQIKRKTECVNYKGGKCIVCGYNKYIGALDFHHLNPEEKEFNIARLKGYKLSTLSKELDKCVLLCKNCHSEFHHGLIDLKEHIKTGGPGEI